MVNWYPYGWKTTTRQGGIEIESTVFFTAFNTVVILARVKNAGTEAATLTPSLLVTGRSEYDGKTGGLIVGFAAARDRLAWRNRRVGKSAAPNDYTDSLLIGSTLGILHSAFLPRYLTSGRGNELKEALRETWAPALKARAGSAVASADPLKLAPGETREFAFYIAAGADDATAEKTAVQAGHDLAATGLAGIVSRMEHDWNDYLGALPKLYQPDDEDLKLYYSAALALRSNRLILRLPAGMAGLHGRGRVDATEAERIGCCMMRPVRRAEVLICFFKATPAGIYSDTSTSIPTGRPGTPCRFSTRRASSWIPIITGPCGSFTRDCRIPKNNRSLQRWFIRCSKKTTGSGRRRLTLITTFCVQHRTTGTTIRVPTCFSRKPPIYRGNGIAGGMIG